MNGAVKGQTWESSELLRVGRLDPLEIVLDDSSVSRYHPEVRATEGGWRVRDLGSTNGTRLNGVRLGNGQWPLRPRDLLQFGEVAVVVEALNDGLEEEERLDTPTASSNATISTGSSTRKTVATPASTTGTAIPSPQ